jgi:agmatinase
MEFLELKRQNAKFKTAKFVVVPVPYEATTTYGKGTKNGPVAILRASQQVENFDHQLGFDPSAKSGVATLKPISVASLQSRVTGLLKEQKIPVILGGEHSITPVVVKAMAKNYRELSVLQLDAHADLRNSYRGRKDSHACAARRVWEICPLVQAGIRSISEEEYDWAKKTGQLKNISFGKRRAKISELSDNIYITIDVDVFDPSVVPATGTPEPGGLSWDDVLAVLKTVCQRKKVVGFDVVELSPRKGDLASPFTVAELVYKLIGYISGKGV